MGKKVFYHVYCGMISIFLIVLFVFMFKSCFGKDAKPQTQTITGLNETYHGSVLNITATDVKVVKDPYDKSCIHIEVRFVVENVSNKDFNMGGYLIDPYVDDVTAYGSVSAYSNKAGESLQGTIAPGKSAVGYYSVLASKDAKVVEIQIEESSNRKAIFIFDVPSAG